MRRFLSLGCCAAYLAFGFVTGAAHVHAAADHHEDLRGLHLDHAHLGEASDHGSTGHHRHAHPEDGKTRTDARHVEHHDGDAFYLTVAAQRSLDPGLRVLPAMVAVGAAVDPPALVPVRRNETPDHPRGPPGKGPTPPRAPPA